MSALTTNRYTKYRDGLLSALPVKAATHIYKGSLVSVDAGGYAVPGGDTAGHTFMGVSLEEADNTDGASGELSVRVQTSGVFSFAKAGSVNQAAVGSKMYIADDQTVAPVGTTTNDIPCGRLEALDGSDVWVRIQLA